RLVIQDCYVADDAVVAVEHRKAEVAFCLPIRQELIERKQVLQSLPVMANLAMKHLFARRIGDLQLKVLSKPVAIPEGQRAGMLLVITSRHKGIAGTQCLGHVLHETLEEIAARGRRRAHYDKPECFFNPLALGDIYYRTDIFNFAASAD